MLSRFCLYGFLKNQRYFEPFLMLVFLDQGMSFFVIGLLLACRDLTVNLLEIPSGALADSFGRRGAMVASFVAYIISFLLLASAESTATFFMGMFLYGVGDTFRTGTHKAMIFEWLRLQGRSNERTSVYGLTRSWSLLGSALSGIIAAGFVLISGSYDYVFYFAVVPYAANLLNLATYPKELDGAHQKASSIRESVGRLKKTFKNSIGKPQLRRLMIESMGWEGVFNAIKDYLQPVLQTVAIVVIATFFAPANSADQTPTAFFNEAQTTALLIGPVYAILFLLSAWASRNSQRLVDQAGGESAAAKKLWLFNLLIFVFIAVVAWWQINVLLVVGLVTLYVIKNFWRPILISRIDVHSDPHEGATVLSIESQAQRLATMVLAPLVGWLIDAVRSNQLGGEFWPIGVIGAIVALGMICTSRKC
jgi:MFS family permease